MEEARDVIGQVFDEFGELTGRKYEDTDAYKAEDADVLLVLLGSSFHTAKEAVDDYRKEGKACGVVTTHVPVSYTHLDVYKRQPGCCTE